MSEPSDEGVGFSALAPPAPPTQMDPGPIRPAAKPKRGSKRKNVFTDDRGFPDQSDEFDTLLRNVDGGTVLRK